MTEETIFQIRITGPEMDRTFKAPAGKVTIGRQEGNTLVFTHSLVSRQHAVLECAADGCQITDLGSANGTVLDGAPLPPHVPTPLKHNAVIQIGPYKLTYTQVAVEPAPPEPPQPPPKQVVSPGKTKPLGDDGNSVPPRVPPARPLEPERPSPSPIPPGLSPTHSRLLPYLPGIYHNDFMTRFLALFESVLTPIEWTVDNFDLFLAPQTAPVSFLPWLSNWFELTFDSTWSESQRRTLLGEAHQIYARRGTKWALSRLLEIYTGHIPEIDDQINESPFTFVVKIPLSPNQVDIRLIEQLIDAHKPAQKTPLGEIFGLDE